jgi:hypothetical protein
VPEIHFTAVLDPNSTNNDMELKGEAEDKELHRLAKVQNLLGMWQGSQTLRAKQKESGAQNQQMTPVGYISATEEIVKACRSNFHRDGDAQYKLLEQSPVPPAVSEEDLPRG